MSRVVLFLGLFALAARAELFYGDRPDPLSIPRPSPQPRLLLTRGGLTLPTVLRANLEAVAQMRVYRDYHRVYLARVPEYLYDLDRLTAPPGERDRIHVANVGRMLAGDFGTDPHLTAYLAQQGITKERLKAGEKFVIVDVMGSGELYRRVVDAALRQFPPEEREKYRAQFKGHMVGVSGAKTDKQEPLHPSSRAFHLGLDPHVESVDRPDFLFNSRNYDRLPRSHGWGTHIVNRGTEEKPVWDVVSFPDEATMKLFRDRLAEGSLARLRLDLLLAKSEKEQNAAKEAYLGPAADTHGRAKQWEALRIAGLVPLPTFDEMERIRSTMKTENAGRDEALARMLQEHQIWNAQQPETLYLLTRRMAFYDELTDTVRELGRLLNNPKPLDQATRVQLRRLWRERVQEILSKQDPHDPYVHAAFLDFMEIVDKNFPEIETSYSALAFQLGGKKIESPVRPADISKLVTAQEASRQAALEALALKGIPKDRLTEAQEGAIRAWASRRLVSHFDHAEALKAFTDYLTSEDTTGTEKQNLARLLSFEMSNGRIPNKSRPALVKALLDVLIDPTILAVPDRMAEVADGLMSLKPEEHAETKGLFAEAMLSLALRGATAQDTVDKDPQRTRSDTRREAIVLASIQRALLRMGQNECLALLTMSAV